MTSRKDVVNIVVRGYVEILRRQPDTKGKEDFINAILCGVTEERFRHTLETSEEYPLSLTRPKIDYIPAESYQITVLWIGRNSPEKAPSMLMKIANNMKQHRFVMNVPGGMRENLCMLGRFDDKKREELYNQCDIFCHTGLWAEPAGLTLLEAQAHGKPVIALCRGSVPEYTCPSGRILVRSESSNAVSQFVKALSDINKNELRQMGNDAKKFVQANFDYKTMGQNYLNLYQERVGT